LCNDLEKRFNGVFVTQRDFLQWRPAGEPDLFDCIVMNPPFKNGEDIKHIKHALNFLGEGGTLVALCANGPRQRDQLISIADHWEELPAGSFKGEGTNVNTALLMIRGS
jgi:16S rRNA G1207 methylase RsmC